MKRSKTSRKRLKKNPGKVRIKGDGSWDNPYEKVLVIKGRAFVMDEDGDVHEIDKNGGLIPDHLVKPL